MIAFAAGRGVHMMRDSLKTKTSRHMQRIDRVFAKSLKWRVIHRYVDSLVLLAATVEDIKRIAIGSTIKFSLNDSQ